MEYIVVRTCYFAGRLFERGEIAVFGAEQGKIPEHFKAVNRKKAAPKKKV